MSKVNYRQIEALLGDREAFEGNSLSAEVVTNWWAISGSGRLTDPTDKARWNADREKLAYVVRSYATPVAWVTEDGAVYLVQQRFSTTTSKHQNVVYRAL